MTQYGDIMVKGTKKTPIKIDSSKEGSLGAITGKNKQGKIDEGNINKIVNAKKDPKTGEYPTVKMGNGESVKVTPGIKKKAVFAKNFAKK